MVAFIIQRFKLDERKEALARTQVFLSTEFYFTFSPFSSFPISLPDHCQFLPYSCFATNLSSSSFSRTLVLLTTPFVEFGDTNSFAHISFKNKDIMVAVKVHSCFSFFLSFSFFFFFFSLSLIFLYFDTFFHSHACVIGVMWILFLCFHQFRADQHLSLFNPCKKTKLSRVVHLFLFLIFYFIQFVFRWYLSS